MLSITVKSLVIIVYLLSLGSLVDSQVALPAKAIYNKSMEYEVFKSPPPEHAESIKEMTTRGAIDEFEYACFTNAADYAHNTNAVKDAHFNITHVRMDSAFLPGTTYWINDYLHVGHVFYDIEIIAAFQATKFDRIVMQRAACHGTLCVGLGSVDSFYKGYFTSLLLAAGQLDVPIYIRFQGKTRNVIPLHFAANASSDYYNSTMMSTSWGRPILLQHKMYFERVIRRSNLQYGAIAAVNAASVQKFKAAAYSLIEAKPPLTTYFRKEAPLVILFAYRGSKATRQVENMGEFTHELNTQFPAPQYELRLLNTSDPYLNFQTQLQAVAEAHVVLANHGAFEGNMIYMRNHSLLVELFGNYGNNEIHSFQRLAVMFGLHYARVHSASLVDHLAPTFNLSREDIGEIVGAVKEYFDIKPYLLNSQ